MRNIDVESRVYKALRTFSPFGIHSKYFRKYFESGIYCISVEDKILYIGRSKCMYDRIQQHLKAILNSDEYKYDMLYDLVRNDYPISFDVIEYAEEANLAEREAYWINYYLPPLNTQIPKHKDFQKQKNRIDQYCDTFDKEALEKGIELGYEVVLSLAEKRNLVAEKGVVF